MSPCHMAPWEGPSGPSPKGLSSDGGVRQASRGRLLRLRSDWNWTPGNQHRDLSQLDDFVSHAAEQQALNVGQPTRAHDDEVDLIVGRGLDDGPGHMAGG